MNSKKKCKICGRGHHAMENIPQKLTNDLELWQKRFKETGVPDCIICGKPMKMAIDTITKEKSKYLWEYQCNCHKPGMQLSLG